MLIGVPFAHVVRNSRRNERTVRLRVVRFTGLIYRPQPGRPRKLAGETFASIILSVVERV